MRETDQNLFDQRATAIDEAETFLDVPESTSLIAASAGSLYEAKLIDPAKDFAAPDQADRDLSWQRLLDIVGSAALLVFLLPVFVVITIAIWLTDRGPAIFAHERIGRDGKPFRCLKFRTMYSGAEERLAALLSDDDALRQEWSETQKLLEDPRVTPIGHFLRNTSLDELPQLFNVLVGEMALVGPRPIVASELSRYGRFAGHYMSVTPGLTGLWQVTRTADTSYRRRVAIDVYYVRHRSLGLDCRILVGTIPAVLGGEGAC